MDMTRRDLIPLTTGIGSWLYLCSQAFAAEDFWNKKGPSVWTSDEVVLLTSRSPWAKETRIDFKAKGKDAEGNRGPDPGPATFGVNRGDVGRTAGQPLSVIVTWESALS